MRITSVWIGLTLTLTWTTAARAQDESIEDAFRDGLYQEEVAGDLQSALKVYEDIHARVMRLSDLGAKALFRRAAVLRKLERDEEAIAHYQTLLSQYPNHPTLERLTREQLVSLGVTPTAPASEVPTIPEAERQEIARLERIVANSPDLLNASEGQTPPPLHQAASKGQIHVATFLLDQGARIDLFSSGTPLQHAARAGHKAMCALLLDRGAENKALLAALEHGREAVALLLLERGADPNGETDTWKFQNKNYADVSPIHIASTFKSSTTVLEALLKAGAETGRRISALTNSGEVTHTALSYAVYYPQPDKVALLLAAGEDPNATIKPKDYQPHKTILQLALDKGEESVIQPLLDAGAKWTQGDPQITLSAAAKHPRWLKLALEAGLDPTEGDIDTGYPAMHAAAWQSSPESLDLLLAHGMPIDYRDQHGQTALHYVAQRGRGEPRKAVPALIRLLEKGATIDAKEHSNSTPLTLCINRWKDPWIEGARILLQHGAIPQKDVLHRLDHTPDAALYAELWDAYYLKHHPQRPDAVWISDRGQRQFRAILNKHGIPQPGTLRQCLKRASLKEPLSAVTIIHLSGDTTEIDLHDFPDIPLQWGDVIQLPYPSTQPIPPEINEWINGENTMEIKVVVGDQLVTNNDRGTFVFAETSLYHAHIDTRTLGVSPYFLNQEHHVVECSAPDGTTTKADRHNLLHGDTVRFTTVEAEEDLSEVAKQEGFYVCQNLDGPFWPVKPVQTWTDGRLGIELGLMTPHGLPLLPIDWEKALVRRWVEGAWEEKRILDEDNLIPWDGGTMLVLPPTEGESYQPDPTLKQRVLDQLSFPWRLRLDNEPVTIHEYTPTFVSAKKLDGQWQWHREEEGPKAFFPQGLEMAYATVGHGMDARFDKAEDGMRELRMTKSTPPPPRPTRRPSTEPGKRRVILPPGLPR